MSQFEIGSCRSVLLILVFLFAACGEYSAKSIIPSSSFVSDGSNDEVSNDQIVVGSPERTCSLPACVPPPANCHYENPPIVDGCQSGCGQLVCEEICALPACVPPPANCEYVNVPEQNGCATSCGELLCMCAMVTCVPPPRGCQYVNVPRRNGCQTGCGTLMCSI
jgi:hypothetical protein